MTSSSFFGDFNPRLSNSAFFRFSSLSREVGLDRDLDLVCDRDLDFDRDLDGTRDRFCGRWFSSSDPGVCMSSFWSRSLAAATEGSRNGFFDDGIADCFTLAICLDEWLVSGYFRKCQKIQC